jgi:hypothetical protein
VWVRFSLLSLDDYTGAVPHTQHQPALAISHAREASHNRYRVQLTPFGATRIGTLLTLGKMQSGTSH